MKRRFGNPAGWAGSALLLFLFAATSPGIRAVQAKPSWSVELTLAVQGQYRMDDKAGPRSGHFAFTIRWKGTIEEDEDDYRLVHNAAELLNWQADETQPPGSREKSLTTDDFEDKPIFHFNYILQENEEVQLDFSMDGFPVPCGPSDNKFLLVLPESAMSTHPGPGPNYDNNITRGSNRISVPRDGVLAGPLERSFAWSWKRYQSRLEQDKTVSCLQSHAARLSVSFTPDKKR
jgi:hypothetical protein